MADSTSQFLGTFLGGGAGGGSLVTAAGLQFTQAGAPGASTPYWNYDGTNLVGNVPTGKGFSFTVNGSQVASINSAGNAVFRGVNIAPNSIGANTIFTSYAGPLNVLGGQGDGATAIAVLFGSTNNLATSGALLTSTRNNVGSQNTGTQMSAVTFDGVVVASGMAVGSRPAIVVANAMLTGADTYIRANTTGGAFSITLPDVTKCGAGASQMIAIKCVAVSANVLTLKGWGAQTIAGAATMTITPSTVKEGVILFGDGISDWQPLGEFSAAL